MAAPSISGLQPLPSPCLPPPQGHLMGVADNSWQAFLGEKDIEEDLTECIAAWQEGHGSVSTDFPLARGIGRPRNELGSSIGGATSVGGPASSSSTFKRPGPVITLNVGGRIFRTTESTLRKAPFFESMLRHSEEGSIGTTRDPEGHPFVDRCGDLFPYVLEYLRCGHWLLGERTNDMEFVSILRAEAEFFGLDGSGDAVLPWCRVSEYVMVWQFRQPSLVTYYPLAKAVPGREEFVNMSESLRILRDRVRWRSAGRARSKLQGLEGFPVTPCGVEANPEESEPSFAKMQLVQSEEYAWKSEEGCHLSSLAADVRACQPSSLPTLPPLQGGAKVGNSGRHHPDRSTKSDSPTNHLCPVQPADPVQSVRPVQGQTGDSSPTFFPQHPMPVPPEKTNDASAPLVQWRQRQVHLSQRSKPQQLQSHPQQHSPQHSSSARQHSPQLAQQQDTMSETKSLQLPARLQEHLIARRQAQLQQLQQLQQHQQHQQQQQQQQQQAPRPRPPSLGKQVSGSGSRLGGAARSSQATCIEDHFDSFSSASGSSESSESSSNNLSNPSFISQHLHQASSPNQRSHMSSPKTHALGDCGSEASQTAAVLAVAKQMDAIVLSHSDSHLHRAHPRSFARLTDSMFYVPRPGQHSKMSIKDANVVFIISDLSSHEQDLAISVFKQLRMNTPTAAIFAILVNHVVHDDLSGADFNDIMQAQTRFLGRGFHDVIVNTRTCMDLKLAVSMSLAKQAHQNPTPREGTDAMPIASNVTIGGIRPKALRGSGAWGTVFAGRSPDGKDMVVKRVAHPLGFESVWKEGQVLSKLNHPNIVALRGPGLIQTPRHLLLFMEDGGPTTLFRLVRDANLDTNAIKSFQVQLADAMTYLHSLNVAHRDLKPENIVATNGHLKIVDFGAAVDSKICYGDVVGTMPFIAPEIIMSKDYPCLPIPSDIWSLGVIFIEMLTGVGKFNHIARIGERPTPSKDTRDKLVACFSAPEHILIEEIKNFARSPMTAELASLLVGMFKVDPGRRWTSAQVFNCRWLAHAPTRDVAETFDSQS